MRFMVRVVMFCAVLGLIFGRADAQVDVKIAGGAVLDPTRWGGHFSIEIPIGDTYPTYLAPFVEWYQKNGIDEIPFGASLIYKAPFSDRYGTVFFGVGGGMLHARGFPVVDPFTGGLFVDTNTGEFLTDSSTEPVIVAGGGLKLDVAGRVGVFVQGRWFRAFATGSTNNLSFQLGLSFTLGER